MGAAALSLVTAVISPLLVQQYQQREANYSQVVKVLQGGPLVLTPAVGKAAVPLSDGSGKVARSVFITNSGSEDIYSTVLEIVGPEGDPITDAGDLVGLGAAKRPDLQLRDGRILLKFDLLKKEEMVALWVAGSRVGDV